MALDAGHLYWNDSARSIGRAELNDQDANQCFISGAFASSVAVDPAHLYWTIHGTGSIGRADLDGQNADQSYLITGTSQAAGLAVDPG
jgi:hypothetical protein